MSVPLSVWSISLFTLSRILIRWNIREQGFPFFVVVVEPMLFQFCYLPNILYHGKLWNASFSMRFTSTDTLSTGSPTLHNISLVEWSRLQLDSSPSSPSSCPSWCVPVFPTSGRRGSFMTPWAELPQWALGWLLGNSAFPNYGSTVCPKYCPLTSFYEDHSKRVPTFIFYRWGVLCPYVLPNPKTPELCQELFW